MSSVGDCGDVVQNTASSRLSFSIGSVTPVSGADLFYVNPLDGRVFLGRQFTTDATGATTYTVSTLTLNTFS